MAASARRQGRRERRAAGRPVRRSIGLPWRPEWWSRSATTSWRATGSGTPPAFIAGGPTRTRFQCTMEQLERPEGLGFREVVGLSAIA